MEGYWISQDEFVVTSATSEEIDELMILSVPDIAPVTDPVRWLL